MRRATAWPGDGWPDSGRVVVSGLPARGNPRRQARDPTTGSAIVDALSRMRSIAIFTRRVLPPRAYTRVIYRLAAQTDEEETHVQATDIRRPDYFHRVVDCQWACPAHTPVPEYIRLIAAGRYSDAYMVNWHSNVFPGILGRTCDRPCEPACRRGRVEENQATRPEPVAICRLKRVAADLKDDVHGRMPRRRVPMNGRRVACIGAGPASLTVARDLAPLGYEVILFDQDPKAGGMIRTQIPRFRLPEEVIDEETGYVLALGVELRGGVRIDSMKRLLEEGYDAIFVGSGAPRGRDLELPGRQRISTSASIGSRQCLSATSRGPAGESSCSAAATRLWTAAARRGVSAEKTSRSSCVPGSTR